MCDGYRFAHRVGGQESDRCAIHFPLVLNVPTDCEMPFPLAVRHAPAKVLRFLRYTNLRYD